MNNIRKIKGGEYPNTFPFNRYDSRLDTKYNQGFFNPTVNWWPELLPDRPDVYKTNKNEAGNKQTALPVCRQKTKYRKQFIEQIEYWIGVVTTVIDDVYCNYSYKQPYFITRDKKRHKRDDGTLSQSEHQLHGPRRVIDAFGELWERVERLQADVYYGMPQPAIRKVNKCLFDFLAIWLTQQGLIDPYEYSYKPAKTDKHKKQDRYLHHPKNITLINQGEEPAYGPDILKEAYNNWCIKIVIDPAYKKTLHYKTLFEEKVDA